ncbi:hypothetical protein ACFWJM_07925 [Streptomyces sp. NPDC127077]
MISTEGVRLDAEHNQPWYEGWGKRPVDRATALATARWRAHS